MHKYNIQWDCTSGIAYVSALPQQQIVYRINSILFFSLTITPALRDTTFNMVRTTICLLVKMMCTVLTAVLALYDDLSNIRSIGS
jgi:hypothetical protein